MGDTGFFVYILKCCDDSYYVGFADDVEARLVVHNSGRGASWTARRLPVVLAYCERVESLEAAIRRERQIKGWSRAKKEALINGDLAHLKLFARRRTQNLPPFTSDNPGSPHP